MSKAVSNLCIEISMPRNGALLYRKELGLHVEKSRMAVVVQEIVNGERSGVVFGKNPNEKKQCLINSTGDS